MKKNYFLLLFCIIRLLPLSAQQRYWTVYDLWKNDGETAYFDKDYKQCVVAYDTLIAKYKGKYQQDAFFNRMTCMALSGDTARAIGQLKLMIDKGYHDVYYLHKNKDLQALTAHPRWNALNVRAETNLDIWEKRNGGKLPMVRREIMDMYEDELRFQQLAFYQNTYPNSGIKETTAELAAQQKAIQKVQFERLTQMIKENDGAMFGRTKIGRAAAQEIGRASCRERVLMPV